jgi:hypothetical protein
MFAFLLASLATFGIWESVNSVSPWTIPSWLHPVAVYGIALFFTYPDWRIAFAVMGSVAILHVVTTALIPAKTEVQTPRSLAQPQRGSLPPLP